MAALRKVLSWNTKHSKEALDYTTPQDIDTEHYLIDPISTADTTGSKLDPGSFTCVRDWT